MSAIRKSVHSEGVKSTTTEEQRTEFCLMDDDCISYILDWLTIKELYRVRVTCKRLYLLANEHYGRTYISRRHGVSSLMSKEYYGPMGKYFTSFCYFNKCWWMNGDCISKICKEIKPNMEYIYIWELYCKLQNFTDSKDVHSKKILKNVRGINVRQLTDDLLQHFVNLEYIVYYGFEFHLSGNYPTLKEFDCTKGGLSNTPEIEKFFKRNPNIKVFSSLAPIDTTNWLLDSGIKFDDLVLAIQDGSSKDIDQLIKNLQYLYDKQQIKKLHVKIYSKAVSFIPKFSTLNFIESIGANIPDLPYRPDRDHHEALNASTLSFTSLPNLKLLLLYNNAFLTHHFKLLAQNMVELEEIHSNFQQIDCIVPFVRYSAKVKCIYIDSCYTSLEDITITLQMLDKDRQKLENACKLTIYMDEEYYLQMKNNSSTNSYGLVKIMRTDSYSMSKHPLRPQSLFK